MINALFSILNYWLLVLSMLSHLFLVEFKYQWKFEVNIVISRNEYIDHWSLVMIFMVYLMMMTNAFIALHHLHSSALFHVQAWLKSLIKASFSILSISSLVSIFMRDSLAVLNSLPGKLLLFWTRIFWFFLGKMEKQVWNF